MITIKLTGDWRLSEDDILKIALCEEIFKRVPQAENYKHQLEFHRTENQMKIDYTALPTGIGQKLLLAFPTAVIFAIQ